MQDEFFSSDELSHIGFTQIPNPVLFDRQLSPGAKLLYGCLLRFANMQTGSICWPGVYRLSKGINVSERSIGNYMNELLQRGLVRRKQRPTKTNLYDLGSYREVYGAGENCNLLKKETLDSFQEAGETKTVERVLASRAALDDCTDGDTGELSDVESDAESDAPRVESKPSWEETLSRANATRKRSENAKKKRDKRRREASRVPTTPPPSKSVESGLTLRDLETEWRLIMNEHFGFAQKWEPKHLRMIKNLVKEFSGFTKEEIFGAILKVPVEWRSLTKRFGWTGYPGIQLIYGYRETLIPELIRGACVMEGDDVRDILSAHKDAYMAKWDEDPSVKKDSTYAQEFIENHPSVSQEGRIQLVQDIIQNWEAIREAIPKLTGRPRMALLKSGWMPDIVEVCRNIRHGVLPAEKMSAYAKAMNYEGKPAVWKGVTLEDVLERKRQKQREAETAKAGTHEQ